MGTGSPPGVVATGRLSTTAQHPGTPGGTEIAGHVALTCGQHYPSLRCRATSNASTVAAIATFRLSAAPR